MPELTPQHLQRCADGDPEAQREVYGEYADRVYRTALHVLGQSADAEDATQDVFLRAFEAGAGFDGRAKVSTWLYRMTVNHCLNLRKRRRRGPRPLAELESEPADGAVGPERACEQAEARDRARRAARAVAGQGPHDPGAA